jgi:glycosyltransferase involved in cell wall biosynthesis
MDVTVIVPTRNRSALLGMTLRSVLRQQGVDLEVIVVDEASTDDTAAVIASFTDPRIRVIRHEIAVGVSGARNHGAAEARGDWLAFVDDDDLWAPDKLARQLHAAQEDGRDWAYTGAVVISHRGEVVRGQPALRPEQVIDALTRYNPIPGGGSNVIMRRTTWLQVGSFDTRLRNTEDWEMWIRLAKHGPPACVFSPLVARRLHASNSTFDIAEIVRGTKSIEKLHHTTADWGKLHRWLAHSCLRAGRRRAALGQFAKAAVRGELLAVAADLGAILQERLWRRLRKANRQSPLSQDASIASGAAWLADCQCPAEHDVQSHRRGNLGTH